MATPKDSAPLFEMLSQRGRILMVYKNYKFREHHRKMASGETKWRCNKDKCRAYIQTKGESGNRIITCLNEVHTHEPQSQTTLQRQIVSSMIKNKAKRDIGEKPSNIIRRQLDGSSTFINLSPKDVHCIRKNIYYARRNIGTALPAVENHDTTQVSQREIGSESDFMPMHDNVQELSSEDTEQVDESQDIFNIKIEENEELEEKIYTADAGDKQAEIEFFVKGVAVKLMKIQNENFRMIVQRDIDMLLYDAIIGTGRYTDMNNGKKHPNNIGNSTTEESNFIRESTGYLETVIKTEDTELS